MRSETGEGDGSILLLLSTFSRVKQDDKNASDKEALIFGENLESISIEGRGTVDGQAEYEWRPDDIEDDFIRPNKELMLSLGKSILRSFPKTNQFGKLILLLRCRNVLITGLSLVRVLSNIAPAK